ncbi:MAG: S-layer homology domain-containing protein [Clostridiales bacterium]|nr:S-layer homology domain-containing protein [Clostridiales bacterium]
MKRRVLSFIIALALCLNLCPVWAFAADEGTDSGLCPHHSEHTDECGYDPESPDEPCTFACRICPIEDLIDKLPDSVSEDNSGQVQAQLNEIYALYDELTADEQEQVDLSPCESAQKQLDEMDSEEPGGGSSDNVSSGRYVMNEDKNIPDPFEVSSLVRFNTNGYTYTGTGSVAVQVIGTGELYLMGTVIAPNGVGVEVQSGGFLSVTEPGTSITGRGSYALDIASGAEVHLSAGTYSGKATAIRTADGDFAALLEPGYAYFDNKGGLLLPADAVRAKTIVIGQCSGHSDKTWTHTPGATTHTWTCPYCGVGETEACTFTFDQNGNGACTLCGNGITVAVDDDGLAGLVYDGTLKPGTPPPITVALTDGSGTVLVKDTDYTVAYEPRKDAGEITVTVTGMTFNGTFTKTYHVEQDQPGIRWDESTRAVDYDGRGLPVDSAKLPNITITITASEDLHPYLQYSYRKVGDTEFTAGLPTNAGEYEVKAYIPESQNYKAAETDLLTLTINKIPAVTTAPAAKTLTYNREAQELATAGVLKPGAAAEGAEIEFKLGTDGTYSTNIPTGVGVSSYNVYYRVADTENYSGVSETLVKNPDTKYPSARINHKEITPTVELEYKTTLYTGGDKEPAVTVKDGEAVIPNSEYEVTYTNNKNVGTATVTVTNASNGNYKLTTATATFKITSKEQEALSITNQPNTVIYGDQFTLGTQGGSGNGNVTWKITAGSDVAVVDEHSGQVTVSGHGSVTVQATKSGKDPATNVVNYDDATASWTFKAEKKPVTATVTAEDKFYGETYGGDDLKAAKVHAVVEQGVLPGDEITITGLTGTFEDENAGKDKKVTVDTTNAHIEGENSQHYAVTYSSTPVKATINKAVVHITTAPDAADLTYNGTAQKLIDDSVLVVDTAGVLVEYALSESGTYSTAIPKGTDAGTYTVWYRVQETGNYTGLAAAKVDVTIAPKPVTPTITLSGDGLKEEDDGTYSYIFDGNAKEPAVTLTENNGTVIPADQYTVSYSNNVNVGTTATVTVTAKAGGNYTFTNAPVTTTFEIKKEQAKVLTAPEAAGDPLTFNNRAQKLVTAGTWSGGTMVYSVNDPDGPYLSAIPTEVDAAEYTVYYKVEGDGNHSDSDVGSVTVTIAPKPVNSPTIELSDPSDTQFAADGSYTYDGDAKRPAVIVKDGSTVIDEGEYNVIYRNNTDAGDATVSITDKPGGNYTVTGSATFVIVKADIEFDPAPSAAVITYDGKSHELLVAGKTSGGEVLYALNSPTSTYSAAIPTATEAGDYTVYYKVTGDKNHNDFTGEPVPVTIQRKPLTAITIELSPEGFAYDGTVKLPEVKVWDGKTLLSEEEYDWLCNVVDPTDVGTYTITISDKTDGNYDLSKLEAPANEATFAIGKIPQAELVIGGKPAATNYGDSFQLTVTGGSGNGGVTWNATGSASVDADGKVTITGVGEVTVTVEKAADTNYLSAETQWTFTAAPMPVEAAVTVDNKPYDGNTNATVTSAEIATINGDAVTIDPDSITAAFDTPAVGTGKTVTLDTSKVKVTGDTAKYAVSYPGTVTADITLVAAEITTDPAGIAPLTYTGQPQALVTAGKTNVGFIVYSLDGINFFPEIPTGTDAGDYTVYYKVDETADHTGVAVNAAPVTVTIAPKSITPVIELSESSYLYDGTKKDPKVTVKDGKTVIDEEQYTVTWANADGITVTGILTDAGTYEATIENVANGNYTFSETATVEIVAAEQAALNITGKPDHVCYGDKVTTLDTTGGSGNGTVTWSMTAGGANSTIDPATGELTVKDTGSITVTAERTVPNYGTVSDTWTFTVEPKPVTAVVTVANKVYDGKNTAVVTSAVVNDLVDPDNDTITITGLKGTFDDVNAGSNKTVTLDCSDPGFSITADTAKYAVSIPATTQANITPREVAVTVELSDHDLKKDGSVYYYVFDGAEKKPAVTVKADDDGATLAASDYDVSYANNKNAGTAAAVTVTAKADGNYKFDDVTVSFEIRNGAAVLTETPKAKDLTYDGTAQDLVNVGSATGGTVVYSSTGAAGSYSETIPQETNAGTYTVYYMVKGDANHGDTAPGQVSVTIKPKTITPKITLNPASYVYDGNECEPTVTVEGGVNTGDDHDPIADTEYSVTYQDNTNAGTAKVIVSNATGGNYIVNGTAYFEITKKAPVVTPPEEKTGLKYNGAVQDLVKAGVSDDGTVVYSVNGGNWSAAVPSASAVGDYEISYKVLGNANHSDTAPVALGTVTIAKNTVTNPTISLSSNQFTFNGGQQKPTVTAVYDDNGLLIPEHEYTVAITGGNMVDVGTYTVTVTTPATSNYDIKGSNTRTFEIVPANQETISITGTKAQVRYGDVIQLGTTGGIGGSAVTWTVTDAGGGTVNSTISTTTGLLTVKDVGGPIKVTAKRSAGGNYKDVSATWEFSAAQKRVTAVVTADDRSFIANDKTATVHASVPGSELVSGDSITIIGVTGTFDDPNVGTSKKVTIDSSNASATGTNADNYEIIYPATTTASILAGAATVDTEPTANTPLTYDASQAQELVTAGTATGGIMVYSLDGANFTASVPTGKDAGTYTVYFKAQGDGNHTDSAVKSTQVTIAKQSVTPRIELTPSGAKYDGQEHKPTTVTLRDGANNVIPTSEYTVTYVSDNGENWTDKGDYTVKIENIDRGNYVVETVTETFTISTTAQNPLEITNKPGLVYYGDTFTLSAVGGSGNAAVTWSVDDAGASVVEIDANGFVKIVGTGSAVITAEKSGGTNYDTVKAAYPLNALKKPVTAIVTADDKVYDGETPAKATIHVTWKDGGLVGDDTINTAALEGTFDDPYVGQNKTVTITGGPISSDKYVITIPGSTTASILKADTAAPDLTANDREYDRTAQPLVTGGNTNTTVYSDARDGVYSPDVPTGTNAGTYTVWYKELGDANHNDSAPQARTVTIRPKTLSPVSITLSGNDLQDDGSGNYSYVYDGAEKKPTVTIKDGEAVVPASEYTVSYSNNKNVSTETAKATVTITSNAGGNYTFDEQTVTFEITSTGAQLTGSPQAKDLTYTGQAQELVTVGTATGGHIEYSLDGITYSESIPKGETAGTYTVTYKVVGDGNYTSGTETWTVSVTIKQKEVVSPKVTVTGTYTYNGNPQEPAAANITVEDGATVIPAGEYTVSFRDNVEAGKATAVITNANGGNYIVNGTGAFTIGKAGASVETAPTGRKNLPYNGAAQALAEAGKASGGTMVYSLSKDGEYSPVIPTQTAVDTYTVWYKVQGDGNHNGTDPASVDASIIVNAVTDPTIQVTPETATYNGKKQEPTVTIRDNNGYEINGSEYTVTYTDGEGNAVASPTGVGTYTLTITATGANYDFTGNTKTATFEILPADQTPLTITNTRERVYYGDTIRLDTTGGSGTVTWKAEGKDDSSKDIASISDDGLLTITGVGSVKVTATSSATGYADQTAAWSFFAEKKPVTAVVTAEAKTYDGEKDAAVTAVLQSSDLVNGDEKITITLEGSFEDANAGTNKKVTVDSTSPVFPVGKENIYENYSITYPATTTASIFKADVTDVTPPAVKGDLKYTGIAQVLVTAGSSTEGTLEYSTDGLTYSASLPTGTDADSYDVWYRVKGDGNHNDKAGVKLESSVTIAPQEVASPTIELKPTGASYDGAAHKPEVTVKDNNNRVIPDSEYTVAYGDGNWKDVGTYKVTIKDVSGGNYSITEKEAEFEILATGQSPLSITDKPGTVHYGDSFTLSAVGGSGTGTIKWEVTAGKGVAEINQNGLVKILKSGSATITATKLADGNYGESTAAWTFSAEKRPAEAVVTAKDKEFDTTDDAELVITWKAGDLLKGDTVNLTLTGKFSNANAGDNKTVTITGTVPDSDKYEISYNTTTTASITPKAAKVTAPTPIDDLTYTGQPQFLVNGGSATNGTILYSLDGIVYGPNVPKGKDAGSYTVWYKVTGDENYKDVAPAVMPVTIDPKTVTNPTIELSSETFDYDGAEKRPDVIAVKDGTIVIPAGEYTVGYSNNVNAGTNAKVTISDVDGGNYIVSGSTTFTIRAGVAYLKDEPQANILIYSGYVQELLKPGTAVNGRVVYSTSQNGPYTTSIPTGTNADTYQVWYKVEGENGAEVREADATPRYKMVTIQPKQVTPTVLVTGSYTYTGSTVTPDVIVIVDGKLLTKLVDYYVIGNSVNPGAATATVISLGSNYQFTAVATFEITKAKAEFALEPRPETTLVYTGESQKLVRAGISKTGGTVVYSLDGRTYSPSIPKGTEVDDYVVFAKVLGDDMYADSDVVFVDVSIGRNTIAADKLDVTLSDDSLKYTGSELKPTVTVRDVENNVTISASEYSVSYKNNINVGQADVTVTSTTKNYSFSKTVHFTITEGDAPKLTITGKPETVCYGDTLKLGATGGSGTVTWSVESGEAESKGGGRFEIKGPGSITVKAETSDSSDTWSFYADPKPVKAVVTAASKPYDSNTTVASWTVSIIGLVPGDNIGEGSITASGYFTDANAGTNKTVIITGLNVPDAISAKYDISYDETTTASITPAPASVTAAPEKNGGLTNYTGQPQALVTPGAAANGNMMYSLDGVNYSYTVPTGTDAGGYTVWYKAAAADENHKDSAPTQVTGVTIGVNTDTPTVSVLDTFQFDGTPKTPTVVVQDSAKRIIPESEYTYTVTFGESPEPVTSAIAVGIYTVTVKDKSGSGNYEFSSPVTGTFEIAASSQNPLSIVTEKPSNVYYGDTFRLSAMGGSGSGAIRWSIEQTGNIASIDGNGVVTVTGTGGFTVEAYREASDGYSKSNTASVPFYANPKPITAVATAVSRGYNTEKTTDVTVTVPELNATIHVTGTFDDGNAGSNKTVTIVYGEGVKVTDPKYQITWPETTTASIYKVDAQIENAPQPNPGSENKGLTFTGEAQPLVTGGTTVGGIGTIVYSTSQNGAYSTSIPTGTGAGTYSVWYKVADSVNYTGIPAAEVKVEIKKADPKITGNPTATGKEGQLLSEIPLSGGSFSVSDGKFAWANGNTPAVNGAEYDVIFTPGDTANYNTVTIQVKVTLTEQSSPSNNGSSSNSAPASRPGTSSTAAATQSTPTQTTTTVQNGTASTVISAADGSKLVQEAVENQSRNVVIKPEITGDVTKTEVSIPSSTISQLGSKTDTALTVSSPVADVTIPNGALGTLSRAGGTVSIAAEQVEQSVVLTVAAGGETVEQVPGGLTLAVSVEDAGPGTVAVLIHEDGTRETVRKSVVAGGVMSIPLSGSAAIEIVDNSKDFADVSPENWAADAVDFASAHELFSGTSTTTFSPDLAMSRGMLATVLYRLEGSPTLDPTDLFNDVSSDAWYAEGVAWAAENGIASGYGGGQFGPNDSITREQFVVMLWRYAGSPEAGGQVLDFVDTDQISSFAVEALSWAVENGILRGKGNGMLDPRGTATRAQAAQLLKNFMENT